MAEQELTAETQRVLDEVKESFMEDDEALLADGLEEALIGWVERFNVRVPLYDRAKVIALLVAQGLSEEDAEEHFGFNIVGAWMGEGTPAFATIIRKEGT